jgi:hypothetical protein
MIIHGVVKITINPMNALILERRSVTKRPTKINMNAIEPIKIDDCTLLNLGNTLEKSKPVPYSEVTPVDIPPRKAITISGSAYQAGEISTSPTMYEAGSLTRVVVATPNKNGTSVINCALKTQPIKEPLEVLAGIYLAQSPKKAPNEIGLPITIKADKINVGQKLPSA